MLPAGIDPATVSVVEVTGATEADRESPGGVAFGTLVHAVLAQAPFDATAERLQAVALREAALLGLSKIVAARAATRVAGVLGHELLRRAAQAAVRGACRRETPVSFIVWGDGPGAPSDRRVLVEGIVDLAFEEDGRWIAEVPALPGVLAYGRTEEEAKARVQALALRVVADRLEHGEEGPELLSITFAAA